MNNNIFENWKLNKVAEHLEIVSTDSIKRRDEIINELSLPKLDKSIGLNRTETSIDWERMPEYYRFFFDNAGEEVKIKNWFENSKLVETNNLLITYGWKEPMVLVPTKIFLEDWEGFFRSTLWESVIFSEDFKLIMEVSRDYYLHSNFKIFNCEAADFK